MVLSKVKNVLALAMIVLFLSAGVGAWCCTAVAQDRAVDQPLPRAVPPARRSFNIDLTLTRVSGEKRQLLAAPRLLTLEGRSALFSLGKECPVPVGDGKVESVLIGPRIQLVVRSERNKLRLDMTVSQATKGTFGEDVSIESQSARILRWVEIGHPVTVEISKHSTPLEVTAIVRESQNDSQTPTIADAERDLKTAEFYRRTGHPNSARFYYEIICRRYSDTIYAERAKKRLAALKKEADKADTVEEKPPARVGQIFIVGNRKIADSAILEQVPLFPGQILTYPDLDLAKQNLSRLKGLKRPPKVTAIDREGHSVYRDIQITVEEK